MQREITYEDISLKQRSTEFWQSDNDNEANEQVNLDMFDVYELFLWSP